MKVKHKTLVALSIVMKKPDSYFDREGRRVLAELMSHTLIAFNVGTIGTLGGTPFPRSRPGCP